MGGFLLSCDGVYELVRGRNLQFLSKLEDEKLSKILSFGVVLKIRSFQFGGIEKF